MSETTIPQKRRTMRADVLDPETGITTKMSIHKLVPCQDGILGKILGSNFNVFRRWNSAQWMTNVPSSSRFNFEIGGLTDAEANIFLNEKDAAQKA